MVVFILWQLYSIPVPLINWSNAVLHWRWLIEKQNRGKKDSDRANDFFPCDGNGNIICWISRVTSLGCWTCLRTAAARAADAAAATRHGATQSMCQPRDGLALLPTQSWPSPTFTSWHVYWQFVPLTSSRNNHDQQRTMSATSGATCAILSQMSCTVQ